MRIKFTNLAFLACLILLGGCGDTAVSEGGTEETTQIATLYRNGSLMKQMRLHFGSFDAQGEANDYNINNCQMTAKLLNSNVSAQWLAEGLPDVGFWCEPGDYREDGQAPLVFDAEFPTDAGAKAAP